MFVNRFQYQFRENRKNEAENVKKIYRHTNVNDAVRRTISFINKKHEYVMSVSISEHKQRTCIEIQH